MEFDKYDDYKGIVRAMVDHDEYKYVSRFYESLTTPKVRVKYIEDFQEAVKYAKKYRVCIVPTTIKISDGVHSVTLFKHKSIYMFDPNGYIDGTIYEVNGTMYEPDDLERRFKIHLPNYAGIQFYCEKSTIGYIHDCGYCMFYNYIAIKQAIKRWDGKMDLAALIQQMSDVENEMHLYSLFPHDSRLGLVSLKIILDVFG